VAGIEAATGDYYMFVDSDDYVETTMLEEMFACLVGTPGEVVCCNHLLEKQKKTVPAYSAAAPGVYVGEALERDIKSKVIGQEQRAIPMSRCMKLCEKSVFEIDKSYYDYDVRFMEDCHMMYPVIMNSTRVVVMKEALFYHYRFVESSMVHRYDRGIYESLEKVMAGLRKVAEEKKVPGGEQMLNREYCYMLLYVLKNELRNPDRNYKEKIRKIFCEPKTRELIQTTNLPIYQRFNALLYLGAQYPEGGIIPILRLMLKVHDR
jgi:glycosyltransferase involved in cell wall biosynthesis